MTTTPDRTDVTDDISDASSESDTDQPSLASREPSAQAIPEQDIEELSDEESVDDVQVSPVRQSSDAQVV